VAEPSRAQAPAHIRLIILRTTPRVAPGLLSLPAWEALRAAGRVLTGSPGHPQLAALDSAGIRCEIAPAEPPAARAARLIGLAARLTGPGAAGQDAAGPPPVVWLAAPAGDDGLLAALAQAGVHAEVISGSHDLPGSHLLDLVATMDTLRTGCPWDAKQTHRSLAPHLIEESYEAVDALETGDAQALRDELGDVLLQVVFHARIAAELPGRAEPPGRAELPGRAGPSGRAGFTIDDVADAIVGKLVRRHPHVFAGVHVSGADEVKVNWDAIKAAERAEKHGGPGSALDGVPFGQPALSLAAQLQRRAASAGVPASLAASADVTGAAHGPDSGDDLGAALFALVARCRAAGLDPELELRATARRFADRVRAWERENTPGVH
jgi:NTP pyrophosphatase (non-canonical NTP hydrolase)